MQSGVTERMIGTRKWRRRREFPKGALKIVSSETVYACHSFSSITLFTYIAARVADLDIDHLGFNKIRKPLIGLTEVRLKELNTDKEAWEAPAISVAREDTAQQTETAALSMQVNPQALLSSGARPFYDSFAICSPSQTSLIINQGSFLHTSQGPRVTVRVL